MLFKATEETEESKRERVGTKISTKEFFLFPMKLYNRRLDRMETRALGSTYVIKRFTEHPHMKGNFYWDYVEWDEECHEPGHPTQKLKFGNPRVPWRDEPWIVSEIIWDEDDIPTRLIGPWFDSNTTTGNDTSFAEELIASVEGANQPLDANTELIRAAPEMYNKLYQTVKILHSKPYKDDEMRQLVKELDDFLKSVLEKAKNGYE